MGRKIRSTITGALGLSLALGSFGVASAQTVTGKDYIGHWAEKQIQLWVDNGTIQGFSDGTVKPNQTITRAEFITLINRTLANSDTADVNFIDLKSSNWAYPEIAKAVKAGYIQGYSDRSIHADTPITRQEAAAIVSKAFGLGDGQASVLKQFTDVSEIAAWSQSSLAAVVQNKLLKGYPNGSLAPNRSMTRAEAITFIDSALKHKQATTTTYDKAGTYGSQDQKQIIDGDVVISVPGVTLQNMEIKGDLILGQGIGSGDVILKGVTVHGTTNIQGGGENSIHFVDSILVKVIVNKKDGTVRVVAEGSTQIKSVIVQTPTKLEESGATSTGFSDVELSKLLPPHAKVVLNGTFDDVDVFATSLSVQATQGSIAQLNVDKAAVNSSIELKSESKIINLVLDAVVDLLGGGQVQKAVVNEGAKGSSFDTKPTTVEGTQSGSIVVKTPSTPAPVPSTPSTGGGGNPQNTADEAAANPVKAEIAALPAKASVTLANKPAVTKARSDYNTLTTAQKTLVGDITKLTDAETAIAALEAQADQDAADAVKVKIAALPAKASIVLTDKPAVTKARADYDALTAAQKTLVGDIAKLADAEDAIAALEADVAAANPVKAEIAALPAKAAIALADKPAVTKARADYDALTTAQKTLVGDITQLTDAEDAIATLEADVAAANPVKAEIAALPAKAAIDLTNKTAVTKARADYDALTTAQKTLVGDITQLTDAEDAIAALEADVAAANPVKTEIAALPAKASIALTDKPAVTKARVDYDALTAAQKTLVGDITKLTDAESAIAALEADATAANPVKAEIAALPAEAQITLANQSAVTTARAHYNALTPAQKALVGDITRLTEAEAAIAALEAQADQDAAAPVKSEIAVLPVKAQVTLADKAAVTSARTHYTALTPAQKTLVGDITKLTDAEDAIAALEAQAAADEAAAAPVKAEIAALPAKAQITLVNKTAVTTARTHYNALTSAQKALVGDITKLTEAEAAIANLELVAAAKGNLTIVYNGIDNKVTLPGTQDGATVAWALQDPSQSSIVDVSTGAVTRDGLSVNTNVVLIATITSGDVSDTKEITIPVKAKVLETVSSKAVTNFDFSTISATQARQESKLITSTDFATNPKRFTISDGTITIPVNLTWNIPLNGFTMGQVVGSAVDSFIQDYCNSHGIDLMTRTVSGYGFSDTFYIGTFATGSSASITLGGNDWSYFFQNAHYTGTDEDSSKNRTFSVSDGTKSAVVVLKGNFPNMDSLVTNLNSQLSKALVSATAVKVDESHFKIVAKTVDVTLSITGTDKSQFFDN